MKKLSGILWGVAVTALGVILALNAIGLTDINIFFHGWWTLFIIVPSFIGLLTDREKTGSVIGLCVGVCLLLGCRGIISLSSVWKLLVPAIIVVIGLRMIIHAAAPNKGAEVWRELSTSDGDIKRASATFSGAELKCSGEVFHGAELNAVFGGVECDLRGAIFEGDCAINSCAVFGGVEIYVPDGVNVRLRSNSAFGGASDKKNRADIEGAPTLYINATNIFGGLDIK